MPAHKGVPGNEKADEWAKHAAEKPEPRGVQCLGCSDTTEARIMPLPRALAHLKREISENKWAGGRVSRKKYKMPKKQKPDGTVAAHSRRRSLRRHLWPASLAPSVIRSRCDTPAVVRFRHCTPSVGRSRRRSPSITSSRHCAPCVARSRHCTRRGSLPASLVPGIARPAWLMSKFRFGKFGLQISDEFVSNLKTKNVVAGELTYE